MFRRGKYKTEIRKDLKSKTGKTITEETDCGEFPLTAEFTVDNKNKLGLGFYKVEDEVVVGANP